MMIQNTPDSLAISIMKDSVHRFDDILKYSHPRTPSWLLTCKKICEIAKFLFLPLLALPVDFLYVPSIFVAKKILEVRQASQNNGKVFTIPVPGAWKPKPQDVVKSPLLGTLEITLEKSTEFMNGHSKTETIDIPIAFCDDLRLKQEDFGTLIERVNCYTLNRAYHANNLSSRYFGLLIGKNYIYRPGHNGTHSSRQLRYVEATLELIKKYGSSAAKKTLVDLSEEKRLHLLLAAYLSRSGRIDESSSKQDNGDKIYKIRSALIYDAYARQLYRNELTSEGEQKEAAEKIISWTKSMMLNASTFNPDLITVSQQDRLFRDILTLAHECDFVRGRTKIAFEKSVQHKIEACLKPYLQQGLYEVVKPHLFKFIFDVCDATGVGREYDSKPFNRQLFVQCSHSGSLSLKKVREVKPLWH